jgi:hypothetical protein
LRELNVSVGHITALRPLNQPKSTALSNFSMALIDVFQQRKFRVRLWRSSKADIYG